ncbi:MAG: FUSC family protein [Gemmataceae bacterium]
MSEKQENAPGPVAWLGIHYAVRIFISTAVLWLLLRLIAESEPIWAISSMIAVSEPQVKVAWQTFCGRIINGALGCAVGLIFLLIGGTTEWILPFALAATVLVSSYVVRTPVMWRQAPITAAIILAAGLSHHSKLTGLEYGLKRVAEVMLGCVVGFAITWLLSMVWPPHAAPAAAPKPQTAPEAEGVGP